MQTYFARIPVTKQVYDEVTGKYIGLASHKEARLQGHVLRVFREPVKDKFGREIYAALVQIEPRHDRMVHSAEPHIIAKLLALQEGDAVKISGVVRKTGSVRALEVAVLASAASQAQTAAATAAAGVAVSQ